LEDYRSILEHARDHNDQVKLHAGFLPWEFAKAAMDKGLEKALNEAKRR
jgi:hypothetical protein